MPKSTKRIKKYHKSKKKEWVSMAIYRTPLNLDQAVLSCCNASIRRPPVASLQCYGGWCGGSATYSASS